MPAAARRFGYPTPRGAGEKRPTREISYCLAGRVEVESEKQGEAEVRNYAKILIWENNRRILKLGEFRKSIVAYFNNCDFSGYALEPEENQKALDARREINVSLKEVFKITVAAGINPTITYTPPPAIGGYIRDVDLIHNIFNIRAYRLSPEMIIDVIDRAIGVYATNRRMAKVRIINPFYYLGVILDLITELPFILIGRLGFDRDKAESSSVGRIAKGIFQTVAFLAATFAVLYYLGYMDSVRGFIRALIGRN